MESFCKKNVPNYNKAIHYKMVNRALSQGSNKKNSLIVVDNLDIYQSEVDYLNSLDIEYDYKKLLFAFLVQMRLNKIVSELKNRKPYTGFYFKGGRSKYQSIKDMANVTSKIDINDDFINTLDSRDDKLITIAHAGLIVLNFLKDCAQEGDVVVEIKDYENVGWYFDYYNHVDGVVLCEKCKQPFKQRRKDSRFCNKHKEYQLIEKKIIYCIDCGCKVEVDARDMKTKRCHDCQKLFDYTPVETKTIKCADCGCDVIVKAWDMKTKRCESCQHQEDKRIKREYWRKHKN